MENQNNEKKEKKNTVKKCFIVGGKNLKKAR